LPAHLFCRRKDGNETFYSPAVRRGAGGEGIERSPISRAPSSAIDHTAEMINYKELITDSGASGYWVAFQRKIKDLHLKQDQ
jgi:hypothetical protein